jgi:hypothetical protein
METLIWLHAKDRPIVILRTDASALAGVRERDTAPGPVKQQHAELDLERPDVGGDHRLDVP